MYKHRSRPRQNNRYGQRNSGARRQGGFRIKSFDPSHVVRMSPVAEDEISEPIHAFSDFDISDNLKANISKRGYTKPTPIQDQTIPVILSGRDVVGVANTGTGKTAAFLVPLINKVINDRRLKVLIIAPTRELAVQIDKEFQSFARGLGIYSTVCIGGVSIHGQVQKLRRGSNFVIGTPGRLLDLENQKKLYFNQYSSIVLDEVDRMLDMGFIHDINEIISKLPRDRQSLFFSATLESKAKGVMGDFINNPVMISVKTTDTRANVYQDIIKLNGRNKADVLCELLDKKEVNKTLIFTRTKRGADSLHRNLSRVNFQVTVLHGNKSQNQRQKSLDQFRQNRVNILIATDVASRGIDIDDISHVINYDLPESYEAYIHRIGRTGRADKKGVALTFVG